MPDVFCFSFVEDEPSAEVARQLVAHRNTYCPIALHFRDGYPSVMRGFGEIKKKAPALLNMAKAGLHTFVLTDLDTIDCPPTLIRDWFAVPPDRPAVLPEHVVFRVPVREVESWLLADRDALADFVGIAPANFPTNPDDLPDPKDRLLSIIRRKGRRKWHREMLPQAPTASIGPLYNEKLCDFIREDWNPAGAAANSPSLARAIVALARV